MAARGPAPSGGGTGGGPKRRKKKTEATPKVSILPTDAMHDQDGEWMAGGRRNGVTPAQLAPVAAQPRQTLPPRARQNGHTLTPAGFDGPSAVYSMAELLPHTNAWYCAPPSDILRAVAAPDLLAQMVQERERRATGADHAPASALSRDVSAAAEDDGDAMDIDTLPDDAPRRGAADAAAGRDSTVGALVVPGRHARAPTLDARVAQFLRGANQTSLTMATTAAFALIANDTPATAATAGDRRAARDVRFVTAAQGSMVRNDTLIATLLHENGRIPAATMADIMVPGQVPNYARVARRSFEADYAARQLDFFASDALAPPQLEPFGLAPAAYGPLRQLDALYRARFEGRDAARRDASERYPFKTLPTLTRRYFEYYRQSVAPLTSAGGGRRACSNGTACCVRHIAAAQGYTAKAPPVLPEFLLPAEADAWQARRRAGTPVSDAADGAPRPCIECLLWHWTARVQYNLQLRRSELEFFNTFVMRAGEYNRDYLLENERGGYATGVYGLVPRFRADKRQFQTRTADGETIVYIEEVGLDFRTSLSQSNTCLGATKARPLCGPDRFVQVPTAVFLPRLDLELLMQPQQQQSSASDAAPVTPAATFFSAWKRFLRDLPLAVVADRTLCGVWEQLPTLRVAPSGAAPGASKRDGVWLPVFDRVPTVWLRQTFVYALPYPNGGPRPREPAADATLESLRPAFVERVLYAMHPAVTDVLHRLLCGTPLAAPSAPTALPPLQSLARLLHGIADSAFASFERSLTYWARAVADGSAELLRVALIPLLLMIDGGRLVQRLGTSSMRVFDTMRADTRGWPWPPVLHRLFFSDSGGDESLDAYLWRCRAAFLGSGGAPTSYVVLGCVLWRWAVASLFAHGVGHADDGNSGGGGGGVGASDAAAGVVLADTRDQLRYFQHTHLDWLTLTTTHQRYDDAFAFTPSRRRPAPAEGPAPPFTLAAPLPWLGAFYPQSNRVCCAEELPDLTCLLSVGRLWHDIGNLKALNRLLVALALTQITKNFLFSCLRRAYVKAQIEKMRAFPVIERVVRLVMKVMMLGNVPGEFDRLHLPASVRVNASFAPFASPAAEERFFAFITQHRMTMRSLMMGFNLGYTVTRELVMNAHDMSSRRYRRGLALLRHSNATWRRHVDEQIAQRGLYAVVDWSDMERIVFQYHAKKAGRDHYDTGGKMMDYNNRWKGIYEKLRKGRFEEVIGHKMTAVESDIGLSFPDALEWLQRDDRLRYMHLVAWVFAQRSNAPTSDMRAAATFETRYLKYLGLSERGLARFRQWQFEYLEYDRHDDSFKKEAIALHADCAMDFVLVKLFMHLYTVYRDEHMHFLGIGAAVRQTVALRASMLVEPWTATPPLVGKAYYCRGCRTWASEYIEPSPVVLGEPRATTDAFATYARTLNDAPASYEASLMRREGLAAQARVVDPVAFLGNANNGRVARAGSVLFNAVDGRLYCARNKSNPVPIMTAPDGTTTRAGPVAPPTTTRGTGTAPTPATVRGSEDDAVLLFRCISETGNMRLLRWASKNPGAAMGVVMHGKAPARGTISEADASALRRTFAEQRRGDAPRDEAEVNESASDDDDTGSGGDDNDADNVVDAPRPAKRRKKGTARTTPKLIPHLRRTLFPCATPLVEIDLVGCWARIGGRLIGLCVYCGRKTEVVNANVTSCGLSCGLHPLAQEYPATHRTWLRLGVSPRAVRELLTAKAPAVQTATRPRCGYCREHVAEREVDTYDANFARFRLPLCRRHLQALTNTVQAFASGTAIGSPASQWANVHVHDRRNGGARHQFEVCTDIFGVAKPVGPRADLDGHMVTMRAPPVAIDTILAAIARAEQHGVVVWNSRTHASEPQPPST